MKNVIALLLLACSFNVFAVAGAEPKQHIAKPPVSISVTTSSAQAFAQNVSRTGLNCTNVGTVTAFLALDGNAAVVNSGTAIPTGGTWWMDDYLFSTQAINVIGASTTTLSCQEFQ